MRNKENNFIFQYALLSGGLDSMSLMMSFIKCNVMYTWHRYMLGDRQHLSGQCATMQLIWEVTDKVFYFCLFVCFVALHPNLTGHGGTVSSPSNTFFLGKLEQAVDKYFVHILFACNWQQPFLNDSAEGRRMTLEIISWSISTKVWDRIGIELGTPGSAIRLASVARHITDCAT